MKVDTGDTEMKEAAWVTMENYSPLQRSSTKLHTYTGDKSSVLGTREVNIDNQGGHHKLPIILVAGKGPNLMGRKSLNVMKLDWTQMFYRK